MKKKPKHGGARPGAGRPKTGSETVTISFRVPKEHAAVLKIKIEALIKRFKNATGKHP
jgi:hypothetical protein